MSDEGHITSDYHMGETFTPKPIFVSFIVPRVTFSVVFDLVLINWFQRARGQKLRQLRLQIPQLQYSRPSRWILRLKLKKTRKPTNQTRQNQPLQSNRF